MRILMQLLTFACLWMAAVAAQSAGQDVMEKLRAGGQAVLLRHTQTTPGVGDPADFRLTDCATQRNLTQEGRDDARRLGEALRAKGVPIGDVLSSRWCRTVDTAKIAFGRAETWSQLDSVFHYRLSEKERTDAVGLRIAQFRGKDNLFLVTHGENIKALTGVSVAPGDMVVVTPVKKGTFEVVGRVELGKLIAGQK